MEMGMVMMMTISSTLSRGDFVLFRSWYRDDDEMKKRTLSRDDDDDIVNIISRL